MSKQHKMSQPEFHKSFFTRMLILVLISISLINNLRVSEMTRNRDNISATWEAVAKKENFKKVNDKDIFISITYNDAYQINVADFYQRTKIRLAAFVWPNYLYPDYESCTDYSTCNLVDFREKFQTWLANISKGDSKLRILGKSWKFTGDWPEQMRKEGALINSKIWYFNIYMLTQDVGLAYIMPVKDSKQYLHGDIQNTRLFLTSLKGETKIRPSVNGVCASQESEWKVIKTNYGDVRISKWKLIKSSSSLNPVDLRKVGIGTC